ncbi:MAG: YodL domain-containing protein [Oscillibacter sp.]|uniref:YodL domain-containing protein n=1 Tax=uncultured Oscillibacter sp. TaxID=876091 RepID=UPI0025FEF93A|nr:YodL domain-containing protein [Oscillibacter sp.]MEA4993905.1 YodL domain-containing protein [Oscillibacter sp.]
METLKIYQLKGGDENRYRRWMDYDGLRKMGELPELRNYEQVYSMRLLDNPTPEQVYQQFNQSRPADFTGHSLSTSDIIVFQSEVETIALYVNNAGFVRLPELEREITREEKKKTEVVGFLRYLDSGETVDYTDPDKYIAAYKEGLYYCGPNTVRATTLTKDLGVCYEIEKLRVGEFGERVPDKETWIRQNSNPVKNFCAEQSRQEPESEEPEL